MLTELLSLGDVRSWLEVGGGHWTESTSTLAIDLEQCTENQLAIPLSQHHPSAIASPTIFIGVGDPSLHNTPLAASLDLCAPNDSDTSSDILDGVSRHPIAATALAILLRHGHALSPAQAVAFESATYSMLQSGDDFIQWRASNPRRSIAISPGSTIDSVNGDPVLIRLRRPERHNALDRQLRLELHDALRIAYRDGHHVELSGIGPSFCSGGDLDEFGLYRDPAHAHATRLSAHPALALIDLGPDRVTALVHGATFGAGIEIAAFAGRVIADPDTRFALPELALGLVPGAGGTFSIARRIGRQRLLAWALSMRTIGVEEAMSWVSWTKSLTTETWHEVVSRETGRCSIGSVAGG